MAKVELIIRRERGEYSPRSGIVHLRSSLPFVWTRMATRVHRVRSATMHLWDGEYSHTAFTCWCGQTALTKNGAQLSDDPPSTLPVCGTCEGRATGAGQLASRKIAGRMVVFSPRV